MVNDQSEIFAAPPPVNPTLEFFVHGECAPKGSIKAFMPKGWKRPILTSATGPRLKSWSHSISVCAMEAKSTMQPYMESPVAVTLRFYMARPKSAKKRVHVTVKPDVDKLVRAALDPMIGILFNDDSQVVSLRASKDYTTDSNPPGVRITVTWL